MQFNIISSLGVCLSEKGFSLDELIYRLDDLFKNKAFPEIMAGILMIFDEWLKVLGQQTVRVLALVARRLAHLVEDAFSLGAVRLGVRPALRADVLVCSHS